MNRHRNLPPVIRARLRCAAIAVVATLAGSTALAAPDGTWKSGSEAYEKVCSRCHQAGVGPELRGRKLPAAYTKVIARNGMRAMPSMPVTALDEPTLEQIAAMIETSPVPAGAAAAPAASQPASNSRNPQR